MTTTQPATVRAAAAGADAGPVRRHLGLALVLIATAQLMVVLDATIVNVALPDVQKALGFSGTGLEWVVNAYALTFGGLLLLGGRAGDILGRRRMFIAGIVLFSAASLLGAITSTAGLAALVYVLTSAATSPNGVSHWGDTKVIVALTAAVLLLAAFIVIESRSEHALMPLRIFRNRDRSAANLIMLFVGTAMFGMFFFLTIFVQTVWGYSALKNGMAYLPLATDVMAIAEVSSSLDLRLVLLP